MSTTSIVPASSFKERLAAKRQTLEDAHPIVLRVPGYETEGLFVRYRPIGFADMRKIGLRVEREGLVDAEGERATAAETLIEACEGLLELVSVDDEGRPTYNELNYRWTPAAARDLFGCQTPDGATGRMAVFGIFPVPHDMLMMKHFQEYVEQATDLLDSADESMLGESAAR